MKNVGYYWIHFRGGFYGANIYNSINNMKYVLGTRHYAKQWGEKKKTLSSQQFYRLIWEKGECTEIIIISAQMWWAV